MFDFHEENEGMVPSPDDGAKLNKILKREMIESITEKIRLNRTYRNYLLSTSGLYPKTLSLLTEAIKSFEDTEEYENCKYLLQFKTEIMERYEANLI